MAECECDDETVVLAGVDRVDVEFYEKGERTHCEILDVACARRLRDRLTRAIVAAEILTEAEEG